jgi:hypothetical protein
MPRLATHSNASPFSVLLDACILSFLDSYGFISVKLFCMYFSISSSCANPISTATLRPDAKPAQSPLSCHHKRGCLLSSRLSTTPRLASRLVSSFLPRVLFSPFAFRSGQHRSGVLGVSLRICSDFVRERVRGDCTSIKGLRVSEQRVTVRPWHQAPCNTLTLCRIRRSIFHVPH